MAPDADRLLALLEAEDGLYERLCQLLRDERAAFARRDARELERIALGKEELADEGRLLEEARLALVARLVPKLRELLILLLMKKTSTALQASKNCLKEK